MPDSRCVLGAPVSGVVFADKDNVRHAHLPLHGKTSEIYHHNKGLMIGIDNR